MKILIVSWFFPPYNEVGAIRVGKFAKYLHEGGHQVRVVAARLHSPMTLSIEVPAASVQHTRSIDMASLPDSLSRLREAMRGIETAPAGGTNAAAADARGPAGTSGVSGLRRASMTYGHFFYHPDRRIGWLPWAFAAVRRACHQWQPDLIYASGPPFTAFVVGSLAGRHLGAPWIAEFRDRWVDDPYFYHGDDNPAWRIRLHGRLEARLIASARAIVTVSEPWAEFYRVKYGKPVAAVYNGYDNQDFDLDRIPALASERERLNIVYTGGIYPGRRDPSALFDAVRRLGAQASRIRVIFYGTDPQFVWPDADRFGVRSMVEVRPAVAYRDSIAAQRNADVLLLLQWNHPMEQGNCPAKLFEYLAVLRPILGIGLEDGVPATIIRQRNAGFFCNDSDGIAAQLKAWLAQKDLLGTIPPLPPAARDGLSRDLQFAKLERFCGEMLTTGGTP